jgi:hypothetical protein
MRLVIDGTYSTYYQLMPGRALDMHQRSISAGKRGLKVLVSITGFSCVCAVELFRCLKLLFRFHLPRPHMRALLISNGHHGI